MGWEEEVENDYEQLTHSKLLMFDDYIKHCRLYNKFISVKGLLQQGFNKLEVNWLAVNRRSDIKRTNERYYVHRVRDLKSELDECKRLLDAKGISKDTADTGLNKPKFKVVRLKDEFLVKSDYSVTKHRYTSVHYIRKVAVRNLWQTINFLTDSDMRETDYRSIIRGLIIRYNLDISADAFNGGHNRSKYLFPYYYYPLKVLEHYGMLKHRRNGTVLVTAPGSSMPADFYD